MHGPTEIGRSQEDRAVYNLVWVRLNNLKNHYVDETDLVLTKYPFTRSCSVKIGCLPFVCIVK